MIKTMNKFVACKPFERTSNETKTVNGFTTLINKQTLVATEVIFGDGESVNDGDTIYVGYALLKQAWATVVYEFKGAEIILVPVSAVTLLERELPAYPRSPEPTRAPGPGILG